MYLHCAATLLVCTDLLLASTRMLFVSYSCVVLVVVTSLVAELVTISKILGGPRRGYINLGWPVTLATRT